jgi:hypothetical protein
MYNRNRIKKNSNNKENRKPEVGWTKLCTKLYPRKVGRTLVFRDPVSL